MSNLTPEQRDDLEDALHNALCDCRDRGTGFTFRSADARKAVDGIAPVIGQMLADTYARALRDGHAVAEQALADERERIADTLDSLALTMVGTADDEGTALTAAILQRAAQIAREATA